MRRVLVTIAAFFAALIVTWIVAIGAYVVATGAGWMHDRDGGGAMGTVFVIGPLLGLQAGIVAALVVALRSRRKPPPA